MKFEHTDVECVDMSALIEDLLGINAAALAAMAPASGKSDPDEYKNDPALLGLQEFMRRVLILVLQLRDTKIETWSLNSKSPVGTWPDARTARLANLLAASRVNEWRPHRRLPFMALERKGASATKLPVSPDKRLAAMSIGDIMNEVRGLPEAQSPGTEYRPRYPLSVVGMIEDLLRIDPQQVSAGFNDRVERFAEAYAEDPEQYAQVGLANMISDVIKQYTVMRKRNIYRIRLKSEQDAKIAKRPNARMANMITVLSAALSANDGNVIRFEPPKAPLADEEELLLAAARLVYLDHSLEAEHALTLLCDRNVHFTSSCATSRAVELLAKVGREVDADQQQMPFTVAVQEYGISALAAFGRA